MSTIKQNKTKTYIDAGVNIDDGDQFINDIKPMVKRTNTLGADTSLVVVDCCSFKALSLASSIDKAAIFFCASI